MADNFKDYLVEYQFQGVRWGATIKATSFDEAKARIEAMGAFGRIKGELVATIPGALGPFVWLTVWLRNFFRRMRW